MELLTNANIAVLADLHWTAPGSTLATKQDPLPDADHAAQLWYGVADSFKDNPLVLFDGETWDDDDSWEVYLTLSFTVVFAFICIAIQTKTKD